MKNWSLNHARHLLMRAGFCGRREELDQVYRDGMIGSVDKLLGGSIQKIPRPEWPDVPANGARRSDEERQAQRQRNRQRQQELVSDWVQRMIAASTPADMLQHRMIMFWHGHFATSIQKVKNPIPVYNQLKLFHEQALGNYGHLLNSIVHDPAMLLYLDNTKNRRGKPNENLAREIMELFSLGPGNYSETDIKEGARALTGAGVGPTGYRFSKGQHDDGIKTILGSTGNHDGDAFVRIILQQPACAGFMIRKLWRYFAGTDGEPSVIRSITRAFRAANYDTKTALRSIFTHPQFYSESVIGAQVKSPVQLVVGTARTLQLQVSTPNFYRRMLALMGQVPYQPPNVKGWPDNRAWIDTSRLLTRYTFAEMIAQGGIPGDVNPRMMGGKTAISFDPMPIAGDVIDPDAAIAEICNVLLAIPPTDKEHRQLAIELGHEMKRRRHDDALRDAIGAVMRLPQFQLC